jgi:hypothetical protein
MLYHAVYVHVSIVTATRYTYQIALLDPMTKLHYVYVVLSCAVTSPYMDAGAV